MRISGFLLWYAGSADFDQQVILARTATDCAKFLDLALCYKAGCQGHRAVGPHCHIPELRFGAPENFPGDRPSLADVAGLEFRRFTAKSVTVFWALDGGDPPPVIYFRSAKVVAAPLKE